MKNILRVKFIFLTFVLVVVAAASCQTPGTNSGNSGYENTTAGGQGDIIAEPATEDRFAIYKDEIDDYEYDFNGEEFKIQIFENVAVRNSIEAAEQTGDVFNDAMYKRNRTVEERFNVKIKEVAVGDFENDKTRKIIRAGDSTAFDMFDARCSDAFPNWTENYAVSYDDIPVIDLKKPYWDISANKTLTLAGNQWAAIGKFNFSTYDISHALLFSKSLVNDYALESPYNLVTSGKWTFDKMEEMMKQVITDLNGDGIMDNKDRYGYLTHPKQVLPNFWIAAGEFSIGKNENDIPYLTMENERFLTVFDRIYTMMWDTGAFYFEEAEQDIPIYAREMFAGKQTLFMDTTLFLIESMRSMEMDFGIIPYPKFEERQENYASRIEYYFVMQIPVTNGDLERAGVMLEALNSESARTIYPAFFETALKTKYARDDESAEMLDLITNSLIVDIGDTTLCYQIRDALLSNMFAQNDRNLVSKIEKTERSVIVPFIKNISKKVDIAE